MPNVFKIDPIADPRWTSFLETRPGASAFHTRAWLSALQRTYGYEPLLFTTSGPGQPLRNGIVFCFVESWLTGSRLVSLPFSDHCQPLVESSEDAAALYGELEQRFAQGHYRYIELRPLALDDASPDHISTLVQTKEHYFHKLDLRPGLETLFRKFHRSCIQRKIRRAEREILTYEAGRSESLLVKFYSLQLLTRHRHRLPPQPIAWFRNLANGFGDNLTVRVVSKEGQPIASILTLSYKSTLVYKYGCSDARFHSLGGMQLLLWRAIQEEKLRGAEEFDLGRSEIGNPGLAAFKEHLSATRSTLVYFRLGQWESNRTVSRRQMQTFSRVLWRMPGPLAQMAGKVLYRHMG
jgi:hypothetical protein